MVSNIFSQSTQSSSLGKPGSRQKAHTGCQRLLTQNKWAVVAWEVSGKVEDREQVQVPDLISQEPAKAGSSRPSYKGLCISPATTLFTGVWGTAERMSFPGIIWPCLYLRGICCSSKRRSHRIGSVTGCLISADEVLTTASWPSLPVGYSEHGLKFLPLDDSCLHSLQQTSIDWAEAIGTDHRGGILQVSLIQ